MPFLLMVCSVITTALVLLSCVKRLACTCELSRSVPLHWCSWFFSSPIFLTNPTFLWCSITQSYLISSVSWSIPMPLSHRFVASSYVWSFFYIVLSINNFLAQALVEFFGTLSREWALECMKDLLVVNLRGNLQIVVQVILFNFLRPIPSPNWQLFFLMILIIVNLWHICRLQKNTPSS